jgi:FkbM family methyltransferase
MDEMILTALLKGGYELAERDLARAAIRSGDRVLEIGAGIGVVSLVCTRLVGAGQVTSYEANSSLAPMIRENFALNGIIPRLVLKAVTTEGGSVEFFKNQNFVSSSTIDRNLIAEKITVESDSIDTAIENSRANVIVMDVEGAEIGLLKKASLSTIREIIVEVHPHIVGDEPIKEMVQHLELQGFVEKKRQRKTIWFSRS